MRRRLVWLTLLAALLLAVERWSAARAPTGQHAPPLVRLGDAVRSGETVVAGLSLEPSPGSPGWLYVRSRGVWRCLSAWGAPCDPERVERLILGMLGARGVVRASDLAAQEDFGLAGPDALEITLHGKAVLDDPARDELLRVRFGAATRVAAAGPAATTGAFARIASGTQVLELDLDPRTAIGAPAAPGLPPLLDARLVPGDFPGPGRRVERLFLDRDDGTGLELVRRGRVARAPGEGISRAETLDWEWLLIEGERQEVIAPLRGEAYVTWAPRAPYVALADPRTWEERGLDRPRARLTLVPDEGDPLELEIGAALPDGGAWVRVPHVPLLVAVEEATVRMLMPDASELGDDSRRNLWDERLREALAASRR